MEDPKSVALRCLPFVAKARGLPPHDPAFGRDHLCWMIGEIQNWDLSGQPKREKAMRWLGYIQGCLVAGGGATLDEMKELNR